MKKSRRWFGAKVPLASGLQLLGGELRGRLGRIAASLSESLTRGTSLEEALEQQLVRVSASVSGGSASRFAVGSAERGFRIALGCNWFEFAMPERVSRRG